MLELAVTLTIAAYLVPFVVCFLGRARKDRTLWELAFDLPLVVAVDLLSVLCLTLVFRLETATLVSRGLWLLGGGVLVVRRVKREGWQLPAALDARTAVTVLGAAILIVLACSPVSGRFFIWDSEWHTGVVSTLAAQRLPFMNSLSQHDMLRYHFTGDALAAMLKSLALHTLSANRALAMAHDTMFALGAATVTLLVLARGSLRGWPAAAAGLGVLFHGPIPIRGDVKYRFFGQAYHPFFNLSYRPHYSLSGLLIIGVAGCVLVRLHAPGGRAGKLAVPTFVTLLTALSITDETSVALLGLTLGVLWLARPALIAETRFRGFLWLISVPVLALVMNTLFHAALGPGTPAQAITLSPEWRVGSLSGPNLPLHTPSGLRNFAIDFLPLFAAWLALAVHAARERSRTVGLAVLGLGSVLFTTALLSLRIDINGDWREVHRFFVVPFALLTLFCVAHYDAMPPGSTERGLVAVGVALPVVATLYFILEVTPTLLRPWDSTVDPSRAVFDTNCRSDAGAHFGDEPRLTYVEPSAYFRFVGCRPLFSSGTGMGPWASKITPNLATVAQLRGLEAELHDRSATVDAICSREAQSSDPICETARQQPARCRAEGSEYLRCSLTEADRRAVLNPG